MSDDKIKKIRNMSKKIKLKSLLLVPIDIACIVVSYVLACFLRADDLMAELKFLSEIGTEDNVFAVLFSPASIVIIAIYVVIFLLFDLYSTLLRHVTLEDAFKIGAANLVAIVVAIIYNYTLFAKLSGIRTAGVLRRLPTGVVCMAGVFILLLTFAIRSIPRLCSEFRTSYYIKRKGIEKTRVIIYGAGETGVALQRELMRPKSQRYVVAFYDKNHEKIGQKINGARIYGNPSKLSELVKDMGINEVIIAIPSLKPTQIKEIIDECKDLGCKIKRIPSISDMVVDSSAKPTQIKDVEIADLLGRDEVTLDTDGISGYVSGSVVLVTGGGGSIGSELCRQIMKYNPKKLIILDIYENNAYDLENELKRLYEKDGKVFPVETRIASVRDYKRMSDIFDEEKPDVVFHAAAHKHVPLMEDSPGEAIKNNIFGTYNVATVAHEHNVKTFVLISTDKAVNPTNIMGATKRVTEIIIQAYSKISKTRFVAVRFGNVLGSNGSVIPLFKKQIENGGPVTVTHPEITRFFMTIPEAAQLVIQAGAMAQGGEIFILDMGEPVKIDTLARDLIKLSGLVPDVDIEVKYTGLRPGEKLYEELLRAEEGVTSAKREGFFVAEPFFMEWDGVQNMLKDFSECINSDHKTVANTIKRYVPTFTSKDLEEAKEE